MLSIITGNQLDPILKGRIFGNMAPKSFLEYELTFVSGPPLAEVCEFCGSPANCSYVPLLPTSSIELIELIVV